MKNILVSVSGGRTSMMMARLLQKKYVGDPNVRLIYVFANTGQEHENTLRFVENCAGYFNMHIQWVEAETSPVHGKGVTAKLVDFATASRNGEPFRAMIAKHGIPNMTTAHCTRELKERAITDYMRQIGVSDYVTAIGIRADEPKRLKWKKVEAGIVCYPLATDFPASRHDVAKFWKSMPFNLELKSYQGNCKTCWKKSKRKLLTIMVENPEWFDFFQQMELRYEMYTPKTRLHNPDINPPHRFFREHMSVGDIAEEALLPFDPALDESNEMNLEKMMMQWDEDMDTNDGCTNSCEVFSSDEEE